MRKMRKQPVGALDPWNHNLNEGDRVWESLGRDEVCMYDLVESTGRDKAAAGILTERIIKKDGKVRIAVCKDGVWFWQ